MVSSQETGRFWGAKINREGFVEDFRCETSQILRREKSIPMKERRDTTDALLKSKILSEQTSINKSWDDCDHCSLRNKLLKDSNWCGWANYKSESSVILCSRKDLGPLL